MTEKKRADLLVTEQGLAASRQRAQALILAGKIYVDDRRVEKAGERFSVDTVFTLKGQDHPYVSRGGLKMQGALDAFAYDPSTHVVADFGASTGGFTDCLLQRGASRVYAIDVGYGQLDYRLRNDPRVVVMERINARYLQASDLPEAMDLVVVDASFIGLAKLLPSVVSVLKPGGDVIALVKPQFEVGKEQICSSGVVRDDALRRKAASDVIHQAELLGLSLRAQQDCIIAGPKGNREIFIWLKKLKSKSVPNPANQPPREQREPAGEGADAQSAFGRGDACLPSLERCCAAVQTVKRADAQSAFGRGDACLPSLERCCAAVQTVKRADAQSAFGRGLS
ncbi:MAG: TlyA family RNA methyltransferase [Myxococcales bacterium]|nr:MAG: TlyA family RNA methyltransferase [Myxococcales bacterium]